MKPKIRGQIIFYSISSILIGFFLLIGFGVINIGINQKTEPVSKSDEPVYLLDNSSDGIIQAVGLTDSRFTDSEQETIRIYEALNKGVVNITTEVLSMNWFLEPVPTDGGTGSGSIIDKNGYVLTNYHVIKDAYKLYVNLYDGSQYEAEVIGKDPENDFAVIKFDSEGKELITIPFGSSTDLKVGQKVLAIGNPFGFDRTLTTGIVSGLGRPVRTSSNIAYIG